MATTATPTPFSSEFALRGATRRLVRSMWSRAVALARAAVHRREVQNLLELDERSLRDIGLSRRDVMGALNQPYGVDPSVFLLGRSVPRRSRLLS